MSAMIDRDEALECFMRYDRLGDIKDAIAALTAVDPLSYPRVKALVEAATAMRDHLDRWRERNRHERFSDSNRLGG